MTEDKLKQLFLRGKRIKMTEDKLKQLFLRGKKFFQVLINGVVYHNYLSENKADKICIKLRKQGVLAYVETM